MRGRGGREKREREKKEGEEWIKVNEATLIMPLSLKNPMEAKRMVM